eukprot:scaffold309_cov235-Pinguiococcus_pyrenoidosus.AAC.9
MLQHGPDPHGHQDIALAIPDVLGLWVVAVHRQSCGALVKRGQLLIFLGHHRFLVVRREQRRAIRGVDRDARVLWPGVAVAHLA